MCSVHHACRLSSLLNPEKVLARFNSSCADACCRYRVDILSGTYFPLTAPEWQQISASAKDLVSKLLLVKPCDRLSIEEILKHPWIRSCDACCSSGVGADIALTEAYHERIKLLASRRGILHLTCDHNDADTKPSSTVGSAEKKQKLDHNEAVGDLDCVKQSFGDMRSPSPDLPRRSDDGKIKAEDRICPSPLIEKNSSEENLPNGR